MSDIRKRIERWIGSFARSIYRNKWKTFFVMGLMIGATVSNLPKITIDTSTEGFLHKKDPALLAYNAFREQFGRDEMVVIALNPKNVFDMKFLRKLRDFHKELENTVPHIDDITSLVNARNTRGDKDELIVEDLLEHFPENEQDIAALRQRVLSNPIYRNTLISEDGTFTTVVIKTSAYSSSSRGGMEDVLGGFEDTSVSTKPSKEKKRKFLTDAENSEVVNAVRKVVDKYNSPDFPIYVAGSPVVTNDLKKSMQKDMRRFMLMAVAAISIFLYVMFRRVSGIILPLIIVLLTVFSTFGLMAAFGVAIKLPTQILPSFLLAVCVGAVVHILAIFYYRLQKGDNKEEAIVYALGHSGLAVVMTSLTTAAGLASFSTAQVAPISDLGIFASMGVMVGLVYTIVLLPALVAISPIKAKGGAAEMAEHEKMDRFLLAVADFSTTNAKAIVGVSAVVIAVSLAFAVTVKFSHNPLVWFPKDSPIRQTTTLIDHKMKGTVTLEVITDTHKTNGLYEPETLKKLDGLAKDVEKINDGELFVGKAWSVVDILKEINKALNENRAEYYTIPSDKKLIAQEFLLFENSGSDDLEDVVDSQFTKARFTIKAPWLDSVKYAEFSRDIKDRFEKAFKGVADITATGMIPIFATTLRAAMISAAESYVIAGVVITIMMIMLIGSFRVGLMSMIPNVLPITLAIGVMGVFRMPMDMFTMLIGSIAIGLAVDDTVHFMHNFRRYYHETHDVRESTRRTLVTTGRAMLATSVVLSTGFFIFMFATMHNLFNFGLLTGLAIITALLADFLLSPALMALMAKPGSTTLAYVDKGED